MAPDAWIPLHLLLALDRAVAGTSMPAPVPAPDLHQVPLQRPTEYHPDARPQLQRKLHGRFLHITDIHPDDWYRVHSSSASGVACHRGHGMAGTYGTEMTDCDSPFSLVNATFDWIEANIRDQIDFVVWTGDSARHDSDEKHPRNAAEVLDTNRRIADRFADTFGPSEARPSIPVIPTFGNNDFLPHNIMGPGPNKWLQAYGDIWRHFIPEEQRHSFAFGGRFYVEVVPSKLAVFSLNTMYFFDRNAAVDGCADPSEPGFHHMEWLRIQLQRMRDMGMKAILMGHVPPARTGSKHNWDETCWQRYTLWLRQYRDVVVASLFGHMNIDHFLLADADEVDLVLDSDDAPAEGDAKRRLSARSKTDYLQELREGWSVLPDSARSALADGDDDADDETGDDADDEDGEAATTPATKKKGRQGKKKKKSKYKNIGGKYAERYQLSLVSPSVVPNYFPTLRVFEYNITGLDDAVLWSDDYDAKEATAPAPQPPEADGPDGAVQQELRRDVEAEGKKHGKKGKEKKKKKKGKKKPKHDANLIVPEGPPKGSPPGPAYLAQPLTLTGYVQYFANLTYINNDVTGLELEPSSKWRGGNPDKKRPKHSPPRPHEFRYETEYSTFDDDAYKLKDLTVRSYLGLAYRMAERDAAPLNGQEHDGGSEADEADEPYGDTDAEGARKGGNKGKRKKGRGRERNKTWLHFLGHAFVKTVPEDELERM